MKSFNSLSHEEEREKGTDGGSARGGEGTRSTDYRREELSAHCIYE